MAVPSLTRIITDLHRAQWRRISWSRIVIRLLGGTLTTNKWLVETMAALCITEFRANRSIDPQWRRQPPSSSRRTDGRHCR